MANFLRQEATLGTLEMPKSCQADQKLQSFSPPPLSTNLKCTTPMDYIKDGWVLYAPGRSSDHCFANCHCLATSCIRLTISFWSLWWSNDLCQLLGNCCCLVDHLMRWCHNSILLRHHSWWQFTSFLKLKQFYYNFCLKSHGLESYPIPSNCHGSSLCYQLG